MTICPNIPEVCRVSKIMLMDPTESVPFPSQILKIKLVWHLRFQQTGNRQQPGAAYFYNTCLSQRLYSIPVPARIPMMLAVLLSIPRPWNRAFRIVSSYGRCEVLYPASLCCVCWEDHTVKKNQLKLSVVLMILSALVTNSGNDA